MACYAAFRKCSPQTNRSLPVCGSVCQNVAKACSTGDDCTDGSRECSLSSFRILALNVQLCISPSALCTVVTVFCTVAAVYTQDEGPSNICTGGANSAGLDVMLSMAVAVVFLVVLML